MIVKKYNVKRITKSIKDVFLNDSQWSKAVLLDDFLQPWESKVSQKTNFRALHNDRFLFLKYNVEESNVLISSICNNKTDVAQSDRVEIFFRKNIKLDPYYCLEIDPNGKVLDYKASFYRKFDTNWHWPKDHLFTRGKMVSGGYIVEVAISLESLRDFGLLKNNNIEAGIYRGDCTELPNNINKEAQFNWITWVDPKTRTPDFHVSSSFGILKMMTS